MLFRSATAEANGVDYDEMKKDPELAVRTGIKNIVRHASNPQFEGDPLRIAAAHRYGENSEFAKTGDRTTIDKTLGNYLASAMEHFPDESFPDTVYSKPAETTQVADGQTREADVGDMGTKPLHKTDPNKIDQAERQEAALYGAEVGATLGAVKAPALELGRNLLGAVKRFRSGDLSAKDVEGAKAVEMPPMPNSDCKVLNQNISGAQFSYRISCTKPQKLDGDVKGTVSATTLSMDMTMHTPGAPGPMTQNISAKRLGDCK